MLTRTMLVAIVLFTLNSFAEAQSRCEFVFRGPRDMPTCVLKPHVQTPQLGQEARDAFGRTGRPVAPVPTRPATNPLLDSYHGNVTH